MTTARMPAPFRSCPDLDLAVDVYLEGPAIHLAVEAREAARLFRRHERSCAQRTTCNIDLASWPGLGGH